jgi:hypothetical protein
MYIVSVVGDPDNYPVGQQYVALTIDQFGPIVQGQMPAGDAVATAMNGGQATCWSNVFNPVTNSYINTATADQVPDLYEACRL